MRSAARALSSMAYGFAAVCAPAIILSPIFFRYWISADFAQVSAPVAQILFPGMWMAGLSLVGFTLLQSQGRADLTGKLSMIEFLPFMGHPLGFDHDLWDCWRGWRLELALHGGRPGDFLGFRNEKADLLPLLPPAALLVATLVVARFFLGSNVLVDLLVAAFVASAAIALSLSSPRIGVRSCGLW